jgi:hypothetical protein
VGRAARRHPTGHEELGFPKLYVKIPDVPLAPETGRVTGSASWIEHRVLDLEMHGLEVAVDERRRRPQVEGHRPSPA